MNHQDDDWRRKVKQSLRPLRDRVVRGLGGTLPERGITYHQLVHLLYPTLPEKLRRDVDEAATGDLGNASTIRRMLGSIEHQVAPTAFTVQLGEEDALLCTVGDVELLADAADAGVRGAIKPAVERAAAHRDHPDHGDQDQVQASPREGEGTPDHDHHHP